MKRVLSFTLRNILELLRDPLSYIFALVLPLFLLFLFQQFNIPNEAYLLKNFTPGIIVFGFAFITMFTAVLVSKDKSSLLLLRLSASPMKSYEYILSYFLSTLPLILIQLLSFFIFAIILGLEFSVNIILAILVALLISLLYIAFGILLGSLVSDKSAPGISSVIVQLVAFTSGMYFSSDMIGKFFSGLCNSLPFKPSVDIIKSVINGDYANVLISTLVYLLYFIVVITLSIIFFKRTLTSDKK